MGTGIGRSRRPGVVVGGVLGALALSCLLVLAGGSPAPLLVVALAATTLALRTRLPVALALAAAMAVGLGAVAVCLRVWPVLGLPLISVLALPAVGAGVALALAWRWRGDRPGRPLDGADAGLGVVLVGFSLVQVLAVTAVRWVSGSPKVAWLMGNDGVWNLASSRFVVDDGGLVPTAHRNPAPLANELVALVLAPGRGDAGDAGEVLLHDLVRASEVLLLLVAAASLLAGLAVASAIPRTRRWSRTVLALAAAFIPWSWWLAGTVFVYGFWNSLPAAILLLAAWVAWTSSAHHPVWASGLLAVVGTGMLAAWAPLVLVPAGLGVAVAVWRRRVLLSLRGPVLVGWLLPVLVLAAYALLVTRADFVDDSSGLVAEGAFPPYAEHFPVMFWLVPAGLLLLAAPWPGSRLDLVGTAVVGLVGALGIGYLMHQRLGSPAGPWGYYPQKFAWTLSLLAPVVVLGAVRGRLAEPGPRLGRGALVAGAMMVAGALLLQVPPADRRPVTAVDYPIAHRTPDYRLSALAPSVAIALPSSSSALDPAVTTLLGLWDPDTFTVVSRISPDPGVNAFINNWLLQLSARRADDPVRSYAYGLDSADPSQLCALARARGGEMVVHTRDTTTAALVAEECPDLDVDVRLG